jgi:hypothetical protein
MRWLCCFVSFMAVSRSLKASDFISEASMSINKGAAFGNVASVGLDIVVDEGFRRVQRITAANHDRLLLSTMEN